MQTIDEHLKEHQFSKWYLLYGEDSYMKRLYRNRLKKEILGDDEGMNYNYYEGKSISIEEVVEMAQTLPFFADKRLMVVENSGWFKSSNDMADYLSELPDTTIVVFVENEVDKRNRLYKAVQKGGTVSEQKGLDEKNLSYWICSVLDRQGKKIKTGTVRYLMEKAGMRMELLDKELDKLISYVGEKEVIEPQDIDEICTTEITNNIFQMIDAMAEGKQKKVLDLYYDLLTLRESPLGLLALIFRHFNILLQMTELTGTNQEAASKAGIPPFTVNKYRSQGKRYNKRDLLLILEGCADTEDRIKTGRVDGQLGVELLLIQISRKHQ